MEWLYWRIVWLFQPKPVLVGVVTCHCGRYVEVPDGVTVTCHCGARLWFYKGGPRSIDKLCSRVPRYYPWTERLPVLEAVRFKASRSR